MSIQPTLITGEKLPLLSYAREWAIEVPMIEPMRIARNDRRFIAPYVVGVVAVTARIVIFVLMFVAAMVRFNRGIIVPMNVWMVSSDVTMTKGAHDVDRISLK